MSKPEPTTETKKEPKNDVKILTTSWGAPVADNQNSLTVGPQGPILIQDVHLFDKLAHFARERIPERVVHAKGAGAHGYFEVTNKQITCSDYTKAKYLSTTGKRTPVFLRFSTVAGERGSSDLARDPRGFALKHYTEEGNYDMVGNNTPIFFIRDPIKFPDFIHTQKRDPVTNCGDPNAIWDFASKRPESVHQFSFVFSDRGIPYSYRHMNGYSSHTYKWVNAAGKAWWVKLHYKTDAGIKCFTGDEAKANGDADWATRDLFNWIASGKQATWTAQVQLMPVGDEAKYKWNIFDVTKVWPHKDYPPMEYGKLVLNRNPTNYFAEVEQAAFAPAHLVPGVEASLDRMLQGRLFSYSDTHRHRLGVNSTQLPINCPMNVRVTNGQRDGFSTINNQDDEPNYEPNTIPNSAQAVPAFAIQKFDVVNPTVGQYDQLSPATDYLQPQDFWLNVLSSDERARLADNLAGSLGHCRQPIQDAMIAVFTAVDPSYGAAVKAAIQKRFPKYSAKMM